MLGGKPYVDVQLVFSIIAVVFYSYVLYLMLTSKSSFLKSAFFRIYIVTGVCDIMGILALEWTRAELKASFGPTFELITRLATTMTGINFLTHILGCFLMTINRFTAVCFPHRHRVIWHPWNVLVLVTIEIIISIAINVEGLMANFDYELSAEGKWIRVGRHGSLEEARILAAALTLLYEVVSVALISYTIYVINRQLRVSGHKLTQDMNLLILTGIDCIMSMFKCIYNVSFLLKFQNPVIEWIRDQQDINLFFVMTANSYSIIFLSYSLRRELLQRWKTSSIVQSTQTTMLVF
ncbi:hypothetical protein V3C99_008112 [Haemonchus contortus]